MNDIWTFECRCKALYYEQTNTPGEETVHKMFTMND